MESSNSDNVNKLMPNFDGTSQGWKDFRDLFCKVLLIKDRLYVIEREKDDHDSVLTVAAKEEGLEYKPDPNKPITEDAANKKLRESQAANRKYNDTYTQLLLQKKLDKSSWSQVKALRSAYLMIQKLDNKYGKDTTNSWMSRWDKLLDMKFRPEEHDWETHIAKISDIIILLSQSGPIDYDKIMQLVILRSVPSDSKWLSVTTSLRTIDSEDLTLEKVTTTLGEFNEALGNGKGKSKFTSNQTAFNADTKKRTSKKTISHAKE